MKRTLRYLIVHCALCIVHLELNAQPTDIRQQQYWPEGDSWVCVNGTNRYTRALYGGNTPWRLETSDRPIFASYLKNNCHNISFRIILPDSFSRQADKPVQQTSRQETSRQGTSRRADKPFQEQEKSPCLLVSGNLSAKEKEKSPCLLVPCDLSTKKGTTFALDSTDYCKAAYTSGKRSYVIKDRRTGCGNALRMDVLAARDAEEAVFLITSDLPKGCKLEGTVSPIRAKKLSRNGDMGADPADSFEPSEDGKVLQRIVTDLPTRGDSMVVCFKDGTLSTANSTARFHEAEQQRRETADRIRFNTPDPYINNIGGALAVAADGIWGTEQVWLHGAVGWRMPLPGWRAAYTGDALGWHDRARQHFDNYAESMVTNVPCTIPHPAQDSARALARSVKQWGTPMYSDGYICRNPKRPNQMHHYDMNLSYVDELLWHLQWTGDTAYARRIWPLLKLHLEWEKRNFDPDDDGLYDAYACIWASDALYYNGGAVTHSTAFNYRANRIAALIARKIGEDPTPYEAEAEKTKQAIDNRLWLYDKGHWAEFQDLMGHKRLHEAAGVWTIYHAIDSKVGDAFQRYLATRYVDNEIPHIPIILADEPVQQTSRQACSANEQTRDKQTSLFSRRADKRQADKPVQIQGNLLVCSCLVTCQLKEISPCQPVPCDSSAYHTISTTNWMPYAWSINNVAFAEVMNTALAYFQAMRPEEGFKLLKGSVIDGMYLGDSPANFGQISHYDKARRECYRDFGDPIGVASRLFIQGLYGIVPDALNGRLNVCPGFPAEWNKASLHTPDIDFAFEESSESATTYTITHRLPAVSNIEMRLPVRRQHIASLTVNGKATTWSVADDAIDRPYITVEIAAEAGTESTLSIVWSGDTICNDTENATIVKEHQCGAFRFVRIKQGDMAWWKAQDPAPSTPPVGELWLPCDDRETCSSPRGELEWAVDMSEAFNSSVTDIFRNSYMSPRPPYTTLQIPTQGIGEWCHPLQTADIDDSGLRKAAANGTITTSNGISFRTPATGKNIAFTSLWDNYPDSLSVALDGKAKRAYLLMAGSTNHMQCRIANGVVRVYYEDGTCDTLELINPDNWPPIEQDFYEDGLAFNRNLPPLYRLSLKTAESGYNLGIDSINRTIDGGAAVILGMPLNSNKTLSHLTLETLSNDVVIGLMGITLEK